MTDNETYNWSTRIEQKVDLCLRYLQELLRQERIMASDLDALTLQVQKNADVEESAVTLIKGLADQIAALKNDPAALQALADKLSGSATDLAAAVAANT